MTENHRIRFIRLYVCRRMRVQRTKSDVPLQKKDEGKNKNRLVPCVLYLVQNTLDGVRHSVTWENASPLRQRIARQASVSQVQPSTDLETSLPFWPFPVETDTLNQTHKGLFTSSAGLGIHTYVHTSMKNSKMVTTFCV